MSTYTVKAGESIWDVTMNATGTLANLDIILAANAFADWTPVLQPGQIIIIPDTVTIDANALRQLELYPVCNNSTNDIFAKILGIFGVIANNWILATGFWNDKAVWIDSKTWID